MTRTVADLEDDEIVVHTGAGGNGSVVHRRPNDCNALAHPQTDRVRAAFARDLIDGWRVCQECDPDADAETKGGNDRPERFQARTLRKDDVTAEDYGLPPLEDVEEADEDAEEVA